MLTPAQLERLAFLAEECSEVIQACMKIVRHGWQATDDSVIPPQVYDNRLDLERELGDLFVAVGLLDAEGDVNMDIIERHGKVKARSVGPYLHHQDKERFK